MITQERLKEALDYNPETGVFIWKIDPAYYIKKGSIAGGLISTTGYRKIIIDKKMYLAHRLAWLYVTGEQPPSQIDHINRIVDDNRFSNLRACTYSQNGANRRIQSNNKSGYKGVDRNRGKWRARGKKDGKVYHLGLFDTVEEACSAYRDFAVFAHGEFARHD